MSDPVRIGIVGCGNISEIYFQNLKTLKTTEVVACADLDTDRARLKADAHDVPRACSTDELLNDANVELVLNLTTPGTHFEVAQAALQAGKHVYNEKPLCGKLDDGRALLGLAQEKDLRVGCAPDTFLGGAIQTARELLDEGRIGSPIAGTAFMLCHGHESWHPAPEFYYEEGAGPLFDMGPYYLTALVFLLGPVRAVSANAKVSFPERTITSEPRKGQKITVKTPTHITGNVTFESGAIITTIFSFDVWSPDVPEMKLFGSEGTLSVPDPNTFEGPVRLRRGDDEHWQDVPLSYGFIDNARGIGVAEMAHAIRCGGAHCANGDVAYHVLEIMHTFLQSAKKGRSIDLESTCERADLLLPDILE